MTVKLSKCLYPFFNVNFYIEIRFEKFVEISCCDSGWEFSTTISPIMRGLKTLIDTCVDFKNLRSLATIGKENYTVQRSLESLWHTMVIPNADNNSCLVNVLFLNFYSMVILFFYIFITHTSWNFSFLSHMACWRPQIWQAKTRILESIMSRVTRELTRPPMSITQTLKRTKSFVIKKKICHKQRVLSWEKKIPGQQFSTGIILYIIVKWRKEI